MNQNLIDIKNKTGYCGLQHALIENQEKLPESTALDGSVPHITAALDNYLTLSLSFVISKIGTLIRL